MTPHGAHCERRPAGALPELLSRREAEALVAARIARDATWRHAVARLRGRALPGGLEAGPGCPPPELWRQNAAEAIAAGDFLPADTAEVHQHLAPVAWSLPSACRPTGRACGSGAIPSSAARCLSPAPLGRAAPDVQPGTLAGGGAATPPRGVAGVHRRSVRPRWPDRCRRSARLYAGRPCASLGGFSGIVPAGAG
eukprot:scaffold52339_cov202-Isochrysis_galbana.AAC.1